MNIPDWSKKYIGLKFKEHGRDADGVDCWGLAVMIYKDAFNIDLPSFSTQYENTKSADQINDIVISESSKWIKINSGSEQIGDIILVRMRGVPMHVGLVLGDGYMVHSAHGIDTVIENYKRISWKDRVVGVYRHADR